MRSNIIIAAGLILFASIVMATLRPFKLNEKKPSVTEHGIVDEIYQTVFDDLALKLKGQQKIYYLDGAVAKGLSLSQIKEKIMDKPVIIQYPDRWTPITNEQEQYFISTLAYRGEVIYQDDRK
jgi:hypothetical protein